MDFWKIFGGGSKKQPTTGKPASTSVTDKTKKQSLVWEMFFEHALIHDSLRAPVESFVGSWPDGVDPAIFSGDSGKKLIQRLHTFVTGPYPKGAQEDASPEYRAVNGKVARASNQFLDMMICMAIPRDQLAGQPPHVAIWRLIEKHSNSPLARLLFTLPHLHMMTQARNGQKVVLVVKDSDACLYSDLQTDQILKIQVYKGVENAIFGAYEDLSEGAYLNDRMIEEKIRSFLTYS